MLFLMPWKIQNDIPPGKDRWRSPLPLVLVYHGPLNTNRHGTSGISSCKLPLGVSGAAGVEASIVASSLVGAAPEKCSTNGMNGQTVAVSRGC